MIFLVVGFVLYHVVVGYFQNAALLDLQYLIILGQTAATTNRNHIFLGKINLIWNHNLGDSITLGIFVRTFSSAIFRPSIDTAPHGGRRRCVRDEGDCRSGHGRYGRIAAIFYGGGWIHGGGWIGGDFCGDECGFILGYHAPGDGGIALLLLLLLLLWFALVRES